MKHGVRLLALLITLSTASWWLMQACAPDFWVAVFSYKRHPDLPRTEYLNGRLGILQPTYARSYLVIAYRYLNGIGMDSREREQARGYYSDRSNSDWDQMDINWPRRWRRARAAIKSPPPPSEFLITNGQLAYDPKTHSFALNCAEDAYRTALRTFEARRSRFGGGSAAFRSWLEAQDQVFENCRSQSPVIPREASAELPEQIRADRDYQIAAAYFYTGNNAVAVARFRQIASDKTSPWNTISRYMVVRTLLRMADEQSTAAKAGAELAGESQTILSDPNLRSIHGMTWNLVERAGIRQRDQTYFRGLAYLLSSKGQGNELREELWNYTDLYDGIIKGADPNEDLGFAKPAPVDVSRFRDADLTDWIFSFQSRDPSTFAHCLARWRQSRSLPWLLAALSHASATLARVDLTETATAVPADSPAYLTLRFHLLRLLEEANNQPAARSGLDDLLAGPLLQGLPSSINLVRGLRMRAAPTFDELVSFAMRKPVMLTVQTDVGEGPAASDAFRLKPAMGEERFDRDATLLLNRYTSFAQLERMALEGNLPGELRREALITVFARGLMLSKDLSRVAGKLAAEQYDRAPLAAAYGSEDSEEGRRFAAAFLLLRSPEARPYFATGVIRQTAPGRLDNFRDNWWCPMDLGLELDAVANTYGGSFRAVQSLVETRIPRALDEQAAVAGQEFHILGKLSAATDFLGSIVLEHVKVNPEDPRLPEALHNLVNSGHLGCADTNTWKVAREAFRVLHMQYPQSEWARKTPYWFKNDYDIRREMKDRRGTAN